MSGHTKKEKILWIYIIGFRLFQAKRDCKDIISSVNIHGSVIFFRDLAYNHQSQTMIFFIGF